MLLAGCELEISPESQQRDSMNYEHCASSYFTSDHAAGSGLANNGKFRRDHDGTLIVQRHGQEKSLDLDTSPEL
jgi:hypothetical protein